MVKTWFITGISSGLGRNMTEQLLARGDRVAGTAGRLDALDGLKSRYADQLSVAALDVTDSAAVRRVVDGAFNSLGRIDVIVNNAGYGLFGAAEELSDEQMRQQIDTNLVGSIQVIRAALPHLRAQGGGAFCRCPRRAGRLPIRALACTTPRSGALRGLSRRYRRRWHRSTSSSPSSSRAPRPRTSAKAWSARPQLRSTRTRQSARFAGRGAQAGSPCVETPKRRRVR
jgi:NAD(P)-dependent dehydrogenase (short-subunit alcohol dehydrogenase family)